MRLFVDVIVAALAGRRGAEEDIAIRMVEDIVDERVGGFFREMLPNFCADHEIKSH